MPSKKEKPYVWQFALDWAIAICTPLACTVERSFADYEIAKVKGDGVSLVIYQHKTQGTGNHSARVRDNGSKNKDRAKSVMRALKRGEGLPPDEARKIHFSNTFSWKNMSWGDLHQ